MHQLLKASIPEEAEVVCAAPPSGALFAAKLFSTVSETSFVNPTVDEPGSRETRRAEVIGIQTTASGLFDMILIPWLKFAICVEFASALVS